MNLWNEAGLTADTTVRLESPGDRISGTLSAARGHQFADGPDVPILTLTTSSGERELVCGAGELRGKVLAHRDAQLGDHLDVVLTALEDLGGGKTRKRFDVTWSRPGRPAAETSESPSTSVSVSVQERPPSTAVSEPLLSGLAKQIEDCGLHQALRTRGVHVKQLPLADQQVVKVAAQAVVNDLLASLADEERADITCSYLGTTTTDVAREFRDQLRVREERDLGCAVDVIHNF